MKYVEGKAFLDTFHFGMEEELLELMKRGMENFVDTCIKDVPPKLRLSYLEEYLEDVSNFANGVGPRTKDPLNLRLHLESFNPEFTSGMMFDVSLSNLIKGGIRDCDPKRVEAFRDALLIEADKLTKILEKK